MRILRALAALVLGTSLTAPAAAQAQTGTGTVRTDTLWAQALGVQRP